MYKINILNKSYFLVIFILFSLKFQNILNFVYRNFINEEIEQDQESDNQNKYFQDEKNSIKNENISIETNSPKSKKLQIKNLIKIRNI